jgi:hypothetical protein
MTQSNQANKRRTLSEVMQARWDDPVKRAAFLEARAKSPGYQNRGPAIAAKAKERWADPEYKARVSASIKASLAARKARNAEPIQE